MKAHLTLFFALLLICSGAALAQGTPDWMTPAEETICDGETGAAFGLCNAFCEAMDCESANPQASATACNKVKDKFANVTGRAFLPCETCPPPPPGTTCPCVDELEFFSVALSSPGTCQAMGTVAVKYTEFAWAGGTCGLPGAPGIGVCATQSSNGYEYLYITPEEGSACVQLVLESCNPQ